MDINSLQGVTAYTGVPNATPPVDRLIDQNVEAARTELNAENTAAVQNAFEVNITQEAQDRLASDRTADQTQESARTAEPQNFKNPAPAHQTSQIVNIVA